MTLRYPALGLVAIAAAFVLAACTGSTASSPPNESAAAATVAPAAGGGSTSSGGGGGGLPGNACALLSQAEIQQALGLAVDAGVEQDSNGQVYCEWDTSDKAVAVGLTVATYDDFVWQTGAASSNATKVDGLGEAAYKGWPSAGALNIKDKGNLITLGVTDFQLDQSKVDAIDDALAKLVLPRL